MFESKNFNRFWYHLQIKLFWYIISEFSICLNQKILLVFEAFTNEIVLMYFITISNMFESKNFNHFWNIYKSDCSDIIYQISYAKPVVLLKKFKSKKIWQR